ncbi:MAG: hypothetical protein PHH83_03680 [Patescibacteria group bacterium]|nr:hypothetical protein [Patescibacteria group bacterium]
MGNFNRGDRGRDRKGGFNRRNDNRERLEMYKVICDKCGESCEVPFKPSSDKPIYCDVCFREQNKSNSRSRGREFSRSNFNSRERTYFKAVCGECGKDCEVPFKPSSDKPVLCSVCFDKQGGSSRDRKSNSGNNNIEEQLKNINNKLDEILKNFLMSSIKSKESPISKKNNLKDKKEKIVVKTKKKTEVKKTKKKTTKK